MNPFEDRAVQALKLVPLMKLQTFTMFPFEGKDRAPRCPDTAAHRHGHCK